MNDLANANKLTSLLMYHYTDNADFSVGLYAVIGPVFYCALLIHYCCSVKNNANRCNLYPHRLIIQRNNIYECIQKLTN